MEHTKELFFVGFFLFSFGVGTAYASLLVSIGGSDSKIFKGLVIFGIVNAAFPVVCLYVFLLKTFIELIME